MRTQTSVARRGRPAKVAAPEPAIPVAAMIPSKKRGRPAKTDVVEVATVVPPKKRGRPSKAAADESIVQIDNAIKRGRRSLAAAEEAIAEAATPKKRAGRPPKAAAAAVADEALVPKKRGGRPRKDNVVTDAPAASKRGRPALNLDRVAGPSRVAKRASKPTKVAAAPRVNPKMRSRLRQRTAPVEKAKKEPVQPVKKARGRPKKIEIPAPLPKKAVGRKAGSAAPAVATKTTARPKTAAPRKRRGYTAIEIPDRFVHAVRRLISDLEADETADISAANQADEEGDELDIEVELGPEDDNADQPNGVDLDPAAAQISDQGNELAREETNENTVESNEDELAAVRATDNFSLGDEGINAEFADDDDGFEDETELPSETAVLAEIAAVQDELDNRSDFRSDNRALAEREGSSSDVSVDVHQEVTEISSIPQIDGTNEVGVFRAHVDEHIHAHEHAHASGPAAASAVGSLFGGL
ncbi:hypothetical protein N0V94_007723 [Neodidymelliopsis sp. IMI 364377]|nr:hypothetical protein N0V94_007723 [Neodidymelliopsis sp. IMI 364377]